MGLAILLRCSSPTYTGSGLKNYVSCVGLRLIAKGGIESVHPLHGPEPRALRPLRGTGPCIFVTEAGTPVTIAWFLRMVQRAARAAKLSFPVHPHMLRHSTGYKLANEGHDTRSLAHYLGHRNLQSTARYTALAPDRFARFWQD